MDYDAAKVVKDEDKDDSEFSNGKYGKSYDDIREEQLEEGRKDEAEDRREDDRIDHDKTIIVQTVINLKIIHNEMIEMKQVMNNLQI